MKITLTVLLVLTTQYAVAATSTDSDIPSITVNGSVARDSYEALRATSATRLSVPLRDIPQSINVIPASLLHDQHAASLQDALQNAPGLSFSIGDGQRDQVTIRGFTAIGDQFIDGVRDDALYFRDLSSVERIEVLKGPASVLYGRGSAGGLIQRVSKKPMSDPVEEATLTLGSGGQRRSEFDTGLATSAQQALFRLTGAVEDSTSFRQQYFLQRQTIAPSAKFILSARTFVLLQADTLHDRRLADQGLPSYHGRPVEVPIDTSYGIANGRERGYVQSDVSSAAATLDHQFNDELKLHGVMRGVVFRLDRNYTNIGQLKDGSEPTIALTQSHRLRAERARFMQVELSGRSPWHGIGHQWLVGTEWGQQHKDEQLTTRNNIASYRLLNPVFVPAGPLPPDLAPTADNTNQFGTAALYLQDLMTLAPHWKMLVGVRYDQLSQQRLDHTPRKLDLQRTDRTFSPRIGVVFQPRDDLALYASSSTSFQPIADTFTFFKNSDQLQPTRTVNHEIGARFDLGNAASISTALFDMNQTNIQAADPTNPNFAIPVGKQRTRGLEVTVAGDIAPHWHASANAALMQGTIVSSPALTSIGTPFQGNTAALTPRYALNAWIKRVLDGGWSATAGVRTESVRFTSPDNLVRLPGYMVLQIGTGYAARDWDVSLAIKNLLDRRYFIAGHGAANDYNLPGEPRTLTMTMRYRF